MNSKTIVLLGNCDLLSSSVELFLASQENWEVFHFSDDENPVTTLQEVDKVHPDVVVIHQEKHNCNSNLPTLLLQNHPSRKVIMINPNNNLIEIFSMRNVLAQTASDLILAIEDKALS